MSSLFGCKSYYRCCFCCFIVVVVVIVFVVIVVSRLSFYVSLSPPLPRSECWNGWRTFEFFVQFRILGFLGQFHASVTLRSSSRGCVCCCCCCGCCWCFSVISFKAKCHRVRKRALKCICTKPALDPSVYRPRIRMKHLRIYAFIRTTHWLSWWCWPI